MNASSSVGFLGGAAGLGGVVVGVEPVELLDDVIHGLVPGLQVDLHHFFNDPAELFLGSVAVLVDGLDGAEGPFEHFAEHILALGFLHGELAGDHLVKNAAEEVDVGSRVALGAVAGALECRVVDRSLALDARLVLLAVHGRQAEIDELGLALVGDQDVGSLDVAVGDAPLHGVLEAAAPCPA